MPSVLCGGVERYPGTLDVVTDLMVSSRHVAVEHYLRAEGDTWLLHLYRVGETVQLHGPDLSFVANRQSSCRSPPATPASASRRVGPGSRFAACRPWSNPTGATGRSR